MLKKILAIMLALCCAAAFIGCTVKEGTEEQQPSYPGTLPELVEKIYEIAPVELMLSTPTPIDLSDADAVQYYLGLSSASGIQEAVSSDAMISSQAYSLCVVRITEEADITAIARSMFDDVDMDKWICVRADRLSVTAWGDVILLVMLDSKLSETAHTALSDAFLTVCGGEAIMKLTND